MHEFKLSPSVGVVTDRRRYIVYGCPAMTPADDNQLGVDLRFFSLNQESEKDISETGTEERPRLAPAPNLV